MAVRNYGEKTSINFIVLLILSVQNCKARRELYIMKATGIVRRIDDLGRIVIPKEIRKNYRLQEGDPIEIYLEKDKIILCKQNEIDDYAYQIQIMIDTLQAMLNTEVLFIHDIWLKNNDINYTEFFLKKCRIYQIKTFIDYKIYDQDDTLYQGIIFPIISNGHFKASFVILHKKEIEEKHLYAIEAFIRLLSKL